jgi:hypothetical protein
MMDDTTKGAGGTPDESFTWQGADSADAGTEPDETSAGDKAREWMAQLEDMIGNVAEQATPVVKEIGAKAAELTAVAADKAGPMAHKAAGWIDEKTPGVADRARQIAADLRASLSGDDGEGEAAAAAGDAVEKAADTVEKAADAAEEAAS